MKMPEKHDPLAAIGGKGTKQAILRLQWRTFAADIMAVCLQNRPTRKIYAKAIGLVHSWPSDFAGLSSNLAYITSVFIGYIGTDSIGSLNKRFAAKKAGVEDGRNQ